jgi:uncharacterized protein (UPF0262 family)
MPEQRLIRVELPEEAPAPSAYAEADRRQAIADLLHHNRFDPEGLPRGPYVLGLAVREGRLVFDIRDEGGASLHVLALALGPFRRLIKDYHMVVEAHEQAVAESGPESRVQAIDMGRRGLHNEGAELLRARLAGRVALDGVGGMR